MPSICEKLALAQTLFSLLIKSSLLRSMDMRFLFVKKIFITVGEGRAGHALVLIIGSQARRGTCAELLGL